MRFVATQVLPLTVHIMVVSTHSRFNTGRFFCYGLLLLFGTFCFLLQVCCCIWRGRVVLRARAILTPGMPVAAYSSCLICRGKSFGSSQYRQDE
jgi:hypothetical protein